MKVEPSETESHIVYIKQEPDEHFELILPTTTAIEHENMESESKNSEATSGNLKKYPCQQCHSSFDKKQYYRDHVRTVHVVATFKCSRCPKMFKVGSQARAHERKVHEKSNGKVIEEKPKNKIYFRKEAACKLCNKVLSFRGGLNRHMRTVHATGEKKFKCTVCSKPFMTQSQANTHRKRVHSENPQCDLCPLRFEQKAHIRRHMLKHRQFKCEICSKSFKIPSAFYDHLRKHFDRKPYKCDFCEKGFSEKYAILEHIKADHLGQTLNIPCSICKKTFPTRVERNRHRQVHAKDKQTIKCENCNRLLRSGNGFISHQKKCEKREEQEQFEMVMIKKEKM